MKKYIKYCEICGKELKKRKGKKRINPKRIFCDEVCKTRYHAHKRYYELRNDKEYLEKQKKKIRSWYKENKEKQRKSVLKDYYKNKNKWEHRKFVNRNRKKILNLLPNECSFCKKKDIKVIHHKTYNMKIPKLISGHQTTNRKNEEILKDYIKNLLSFCSKECHRGFERGKNH